MSKEFKKIAVVGLAVVMVLGAVIPVFAAAKPAKVKLGTLKANKAKTKATIKWKRAKNANKYEVYLKKGKAKFKKVKALKKTSYTFKIKKLIKYKVKIRGTNGKTKGKFSIVKTIIINKKGKVTVSSENSDSEASSAGNADATNDEKKYANETGNWMDGVESATTTINGKKVTYKVGGTYNIPTPGANCNVTVTELYDKYGDQEGITRIVGKTSDGYDFIEDSQNNIIEYMSIGDTSIMPNNATIYYTLDGTEPQKGQADKLYEGKRTRTYQVDSQWDGKIRGSWNTNDFRPSYTVTELDPGTTVYENYQCWQKMYDSNGKFVYSWYHRDNANRY